MGTGGTKIQMLILVFHGRFCLDLFIFIVFYYILYFNTIMLFQNIFIEIQLEKCHSDSKFLYKLSDFCIRTYYKLDKKRCSSKNKRNSHILWSPRLVCTMLFFCKHLRPKNYENGHKNIFGLSVVLGSKAENSKILSF